MPVKAEKGKKGKKVGRTKKEKNKKRKRATARPKKITKKTSSKKRKRISLPKKKQSRKRLSPPKKAPRKRVVPKKKAKRPLKPSQRAYLKLKKELEALRQSKAQLEREYQEERRALLTELEKARKVPQVVEKAPKKPPLYPEELNKKALMEFFKERFEELHKYAKKTKQLPVPPLGFGYHKLDTPMRDGVEITLPLSRHLTLETVDSIIRAVERRMTRLRRHHFPMWLGEVVTASLGEKLVGYGATPLRAHDPLSAQFQTQGIESTGIQEDYTDALAMIGEMLTSLANTEGTVVMVEYVTLMGFRRPGR